MRTSNQDCSTYVNKCEEFKGAWNKTSGSYSLFAEDYSNVKESPVLPEGLYVVYSYGHHFPMYAYDYRLKVWIGNEDKFSVSTSRHQSHARPRFEIGKWLSTDEMHSLISEKGLTEYTIKKAGDTS
jgi:hypothetical protein|tara:strand:+ start:405 stop:782 length:378 start_codon:yes stop_codon:yes gene_type:complete